MTETAARNMAVRLGGSAAAGLAGVAASFGRTNARTNLYKRLMTGRPEWVWNTALVILVSTGVGLFLGIADLVHGGGRAEILNKLISCWVWAPLVPLVLAIDRRLPLSDNQFPLRLAVHFGLSLLGAGLHSLMVGLAELPFTIISWSPIHAPQYFYYYLVGGWFDYWAIFALIFALRYYNRYCSSQFEIERLKNRYLQLHLDNLRMQLEPHFLSNALNAVSSTTETDPPLARRIIADLGALLRLSHEYRDRQLIPLKEEMAILEHYLAIQRVRFGERVRIVIDIAPDVDHVLVPCLLLQPLVENSIRHGIMETSAYGTISIIAERIGGEIRIQLTDDGVGLPPDWNPETSCGQGLTITRERLDALYPGGMARFAIGTPACGGTEVLVNIPDLSGQGNR